MIDHAGKAAFGIVQRQGWTSNDISHHVAAGGKRGHEISVKSLNERTKSALSNPMELDSLPRCQPDASVGDLVGNGVKRKPLCCSEASTGNGHPEHEDELQRLLRERSLTSDISIILGVDPMELQQLLGIMTDICS